MREFFLYLLTAAFLENLVFSTGFGSSILLRISHKRQNLLPFSILLCFFTVVTMAICYPLDLLIGTGVVAKWLRPLMMITVSALLYVGVVMLLMKKLPSIYSRVKRMLPMTVFNNLVIGIVLIVNQKFSTTYLGALGLAFGACLGFLILSWLTEEGMERLDNPDVPKAFRGLPSILIYLGILALALMGFSTGVSFI